MLKNKFVYCLIVGFILFVSNAFGAETPTMNAIFNGDFEHGETGWRLDNNENAVIQVIKFPIQDKLINAVRIEISDKQGDFWFYNAYPIKIHKDRSYRLKVTAEGQGMLAVGVFEYGPNFLRNNKSTTFVLSSNPTEYYFDYSPSSDATEIRPAIVLNPIASKSGYSASAKVYHFELSLPADEFESSTAWPKIEINSGQKSDPLKIFEEKFENYTGIIESDKKKMADETEVNSVVLPYKPIKRIDEKRFELTTSEISFKNSVFPQSIQVLGGEILAGDISLKIDIDDEPNSATCEEIKIMFEGNSVKLQQILNYGKLKVKVEGELLYDALMIITLDFTASEPTIVDRVELEIPFKKDIGKYCRYESFRGKPNLKYGFGPIPEKGEKVEVKCSLLNGQWPNSWNPAVSSEDTITIWNWDEGFLPYFWIGDEEKGLGWIAESDKGWHNKNKDATVTIQRTQDELIAKVNFITDPVTIKDSRKIQFAMQVTPPKRIREDWVKVKVSSFNIDNALDNYRKLSQSQRENPPTTFAKRRELTSFWYNAWSLGCGSPSVNEKDKEYFKEMVTACRYYGVEILPYLTPTHLTMNSPEGYYYGYKTKEWAEKPYIVNAPWQSLPSGEPDIRSAYVKLCTKSDFSEYQAWAIGKLIDEYDISGIYFDNCSISPCTNTAHGCGYVDDSGNIRPTIPFFAVRKFFMMVRNEFIKRGKIPLIYCHSGHYPAEMSFMDFVLTGEGVYGIYPTRTLTLGEFRADMIGYNQFGTISVFLPQFNYWNDPKEAYQEKVTRRLMAMTFQHGTKIFPVFCNKGPIEETWKIFDEELQEDKVDFLPYWKWDINKLQNKNSVYLSLYRQSNKAILVASNLSQTKQTVRISTKSMKEVFANVHKITDPFDKTKIEFNDDYIEFNIEDEDFRLLLLE